jgi:hypothetical protein
MHYILCTLGKDTWGNRNETGTARTLSLSLSSFAPSSPPCPSSPPQAPSSASPLFDLAVIIVRGASLARSEHKERMVADHHHDFLPGRVRAAPCRRRRNVMPTAMSSGVL